MSNKRLQKMNVQCNFVMIPSMILVYLQLMMAQNLDHINFSSNGTANLSTTWINNNISAPIFFSFNEGSKVKALLVRGNSGPSFASGFFCNGLCDTYIFGIFIVQTDNASRIILPKQGSPQVVWSANRNHPVKLNATLQLTSGGDLTLRDVDGSLAWSTNTSGKSVAGLNLTEMGNLVLFDSRNWVVWQSFSNPTDTLVFGQKLVSGQNLIASVSLTNWREGGLYSVSVNDNGLFAYFQSNPPEIYYAHDVTGIKTDREPSYVKFQNGSLGFYLHSSEPSAPDTSLSLPLASPGLYMRLEPDGHLRVYGWSSGWHQQGDIFTHSMGRCNYPLECGSNSICSYNKCSCPKLSNTSTSYFKLVDALNPSLGCSEIIPLDCNAVQYHSFIELDGVSYFTFRADISDTDISSCKTACLGNCSCKAAIFRYGATHSRGDCYLSSHLFSVNSDRNKRHYNSSIFIKVQTSPSNPLPGLPSSGSITKSISIVIVGSTVGAFILLAILVGYIIFVWRKKNIISYVEEDYLDFVPGMPTRFSFEELERATYKFSNKLGEGAYGTVFEGSLEDGTKIAVKSLDGVGKVKKSFLAEVESIANTHHVNLVRLIGFCAENSHRLLVYEYMINGSLDKWIYPRKQEFSLNWEFRKKIVLDIAKGLAYLHEDCRQKIIHLDIKPQNILLDENFNAKLSDFGLSKLIDKDQSQVMTTMKGTPGYLAPEWLYSMVTEKVDVYSFGVVVLEILCGRRIMVESETEERRHLLTLFKKKAAEGLFLEMIDDRDDDDKEMSCNDAEVEKLLRIAGWCLQNDYTNRPSMSIVVKVLEGLVDVDTKVDYSFFPSEDSLDYYWPQIQSETGTRLSAVVLSGPR